MIVSRDGVPDFDYAVIIDAVDEADARAAAIRGGSDFYDPSEEGLTFDVAPDSEISEFEGLELAVRSMMTLSSYFADHVNELGAEQ